MEIIKKREFQLIIDNKEILKSLSYSLERKFKDVKFEIREKEELVVAEFNSLETEQAFREAIEFYNKSFSKINKKISTKVIWSNNISKEKIDLKFDQYHTDLPGVQYLGSDHTMLINLLDKVFKIFFLKLGALEITVPSLISTKNLERCKYLPRDSHQISQLHSLLSGETQACLSPAACLPLYPALENMRINEGITSYTFKSLVYRFEGGVFSEIPLERNWEYPIREFVGFYSLNENDQILKKYTDFMNYFCKAFNIPSRLQTASDTFFHEESSKMIAHQLLMAKKYETVYLSKKNKEIALSSINFHDSIFTNEFNITSSRQTSNSLCIGIGLYRTIKAILESNKDDVSECEKIFQLILTEQS